MNSGSKVGDKNTRMWPFTPRERKPKKRSNVAWRRINGLKWRKCLIDTAIKSYMDMFGTDPETAREQIAHAAELVDQIPFVIQNSNKPDRGIVARHITMKKRQASM
jgi:hypothetical protein